MQPISSPMQRKSPTASDQQSHITTRPLPKCASSSNIDASAPMRSTRMAAAMPETVAYFCDPVLGDGGKLYVPEALVEIYRDDVVPLATVRP